jgi:hypothetical protein
VHSATVIRGLRPEDGPGLAQVWMDIATYYTDLDPDLFRMPDREQVQHGFDELAHRELRAHTDDGAWVAETDGQIAVLLFARLEPPLASAGWQLLRDLARTRLIVDAARRPSPPGTRCLAADRPPPRAPPDAARCPG